ncbi:hypothetical protein [Phaeobacter inhibens]|uniref:DUF7946 domain-containing protein n=1 Tax=Phaeobacter inhibens TaxID=221822 RepID=UPI0001632C8C|nr:hypothetical protein [Phaeobacter inhibens]AFO91557.1 hypothetical protein PGA1_c18600 [Phaeobacter inhibens DSM 17395]AUQ46224.1 hypothetical protein PhaeoP10_01886 [Phaeobacter inhibens]
MSISAEHHQPNLHFKYDGHDADRHVLPARELGGALVALDKLTSILFNSLQAQKPIPRTPSKSFISLMAKPPEQGSVDLPALITESAWLLPLAADMGAAVRGKLVEHFVNYVLLLFGGRNAEAEKTMDRLLDIVQKSQQLQHEDRQKERDDRQLEREHVRQIVHELASTQRAAAKVVVKPIGRSSREFSAYTDDESIIIDEATADAIRSKEEVEVSDLVEMEFRVDGLVRQERKLRVFDPENADRELWVQIADPTFDEEPNVYLQALVEHRTLRLIGKSTRNKASGKLVKFHAINAEIADP